MTTPRHDHDTPGDRRRGSRASRRRRLLRAALAGVLLPVVLVAAACSADEEPEQVDRPVSYWLWDSNQLPAYEQCAADFTAETGIEVDITQLGFDDYWTKLTAGFLAGTQPDVFTNHITRFAQFVDLGVLEPLDERPELADLDERIYQPNLAGNWVGEDGHRYGTPKDWDTVAYFYDESVLAEAGVSARDLAEARWNPDDGGTFEEIIARLTVDENGVRGNEPGFDRTKVKTYGLATNDAGSFDGQTQWSHFAASNGWEYTNRNPWGDHYNYDQPAFQETIDWYFGLAEKGYLAPYPVFSESNGPDAQLASGQAALSMNGSWMLTTYTTFDTVDLGIAPTPVGPIGERRSMMNGLADSITRESTNKDNAAQWVAYLASAECQQTVGETGVVFPASTAGTDAAIDAWRDKGVDVSAFTDYVEEQETFSFPVSNYTADVDALMKPAMQDVYANGVPVSTLTETNQQINVLFDQNHR